MAAFVYVVGECIVGVELFHLPSLLGLLDMLTRQEGLSACFVPLVINTHNVDTPIIIQSLIYLQIRKD